MIYSVYFSPTGGTKKAADMLLCAWSENKAEVKMIDLCEQEDFSKYTFEKDDVVFLSVPSYCGRVPDIAVKRLEKMTGNGARAVLVVVYGNRDYDDTLLELKDVLSRQGFIPWAAVTAIAKHSVVKEIAADRPDAADEKELRAFGIKIKESLEKELDGECLKVELPVKGNYPYKEYHGIPLKPRAGKNCAACALCAMKCPVGAISKEDPGMTDESKCISCMRCIEICPRKERKVDEIMLKATRDKLRKPCAERKENTCVIADRYFAYK